MKALIIGASGASGKELVKEMLKDDKFKQVFAYTRSHLELSHPRLQNILINFENISSLSLPNADILFSTLGTTLKQAKSKAAQRRVDYDYQLEFAKLASQAGVPSYVLLSSAGAGGAGFYLRLKGELDESVSKLGFKSISIFRPGLLQRGQGQQELGAHNRGNTPSSKPIFPFSPLPPTKLKPASKGDDKSWQTRR